MAAQSIHHHLQYIVNATDKNLRALLATWRLLLSTFALSRRMQGAYFKTTARIESQSQHNSTLSVALFYLA